MFFVTTKEEKSSMTINSELTAQILRYYHVEKWRVNTIARQLGVHHGTVARVLAQAGLPTLKRGTRPPSIELCDEDDDFFSSAVAPECTPIDVNTAWCKVKIHSEHRFNPFLDTVRRGVG
jgi:hypothetical protein